MKMYFKYLNILDITSKYKNSDDENVFQIFKYIRYNF